MQQRKLIHSHVPKTAGSAFINRIIWRNYSKEERFSWYGGKISRDDSEWDKFWKAKAVSGHIPYGFFQGLPPDSKYISFLREPVDRSISLLNFGMLRCNNGIEQLIGGNEKSSEIDPNDLIYRLVRHEGLLSRWSDVMTRYASGLFPKSIESCEDRLSSAKKNIVSSDYSVLRTDRFEAETRHFCESNGLDFFSEVDRSQFSDEEAAVKKLGRIVRKGDLTEGSKKIIEDLNSCDARLWDYVVGLDSGRRIC